MKRFLWIIISVMAITGCVSTSDVNNENSTLDKFLFFMDLHETDVHSYPYDHFSEFRKSWNIDSIHAFFAKIDTNEFKPVEVEPGEEKGARKVKQLELLPDEWLDSLCTDEQLVELVYDKSHSAAVKITAFATLIERKYDGLEKMILDNYQDTTKIEVHDYDYSWDERAGSIFLRYGDIARERGLITAQDSIMNDSMAFFTPNLPAYVFVENKLERKQIVEERYYKRIREMYFKEPDEAFLRALARYHKAEDKELIANELTDYTKDSRWFSNIEYAASAIEVWPDPYFKPLLAEVRDKIVNGEINDSRLNNRFIKAVLAYDYSWAHKFLDETFRAEAKAPKRKYQQLLVDEFHSVLICDEYPRYKDLLKKYPSKQYTNN